MTRLIWGGVTVAFAGLSVAASATAPKTAGPPAAPRPQRVEGIEGLHENTYRDGRVIIAGQPSAAALGELRDLGVTAVVNVRTPPEMENRETVPFDEAAVVEGLGVEYVTIPLGGRDHPYSPAAVDAFAAVLDRTEGDVLLHCGMAVRAAYLWVAYLVREKGVAVDEAWARGRAIAIGPDPLERLLGRPLTRTLADSP
ncbi:MAG: sulfur transferase domain-containing protein [Acidobacteriota bacterium]|jgi:protein tyrosine phosphatase (PTP) superfamily phosphohydrolase (DUF442 family)